MQVLLFLGLMMECRLLFLGLGVIVVERDTDTLFSQSFIYYKVTHLQEYGQHIEYINVYFFRHSFGKKGISREHIGGRDNNYMMCDVL